MPLKTFFNSKLFLIITIFVSLPFQSNSKNLELISSELRQLRNKASNGSAEAQFKLASKYFEGDGVIKNLKLAATLFSQSSAGGFIKAHFICGLIYEKGIGVKASIARAIQYYSLSAKEGDMEAQFKLGIILTKDPQKKLDLKKGFIFLESAAKSGHISAQRNLGIKLMKVNPQVAIRWLLAAANAGDAMAQHKMGMLHFADPKQYFKRWNTTLDPNKAYNWFMLAAKQGYAESQYLIANLYEIGFTTDKIPKIKKARYWYKLAANQGYPFAKLMLMQISNINSAINFFKKNAKNGFIISKYNLGLIYSEGKYIKTNHQEAFKWFNRVAGSKGALSFEASFLIGHMYLEGNGVKANRNKAIEKIFFAAKNGHLGALNWLAIDANKNNLKSMEKYGLILSRHTNSEISQKGHIWLKKAAKLGSADAAYELGQAFENININGSMIKRSEYWYSKAALLGHKVSKQKIRILNEKEECFKQDKKTLVFISFGQSNSGNHGNILHVPSKLVQVHFNGNCYHAKDPLPGASGLGGSVWSRFADLVIESKTFQKVIIKNISEGGSSVKDWVPNGKYYSRLVNAISDLKARGLEISYILWHQGEQDAHKMHPNQYKNYFLMIAKKIKKQLGEVPIYVAVTTYCNEIGLDTEIQNAQRQLSSEHSFIKAGPNTDLFIEESDRFDGCHFSEQGMKKTAKAWFSALQAQQ